MLQSVESAQKSEQTENTPFAHPSELEFARILDFYCIKWQYEPKTFELAWDDKGKATFCFTPDFYLPELDLFIELTTLQQRLVTRKNRKIRRMKELYPDVSVKLLYQRDYRSLLLKYGIEPAASSSDYLAVDVPDVVTVGSS